MSVHVISWVLRNSEETLGNRLVLLALADKAEEDGTNAWPSVATLAQEARLSERQVQRCLRSLEASGSITRTGLHRSGQQRHGTFVYTVVMKNDKMSPFTEPKGDISSTQRVTPTSPDPSLEPSLAEDVVPTSSAEPNVQALVASFVDMSREQGAEPPKRVVGQIAKELKTLSEEASEDELRAALARLLDRGLHPSSLSGCLFDVRQRGTAANGADPLGELLAAHEGRWPTGARMVRGTHAVSYVHDPLGYDTPTHPVGWARPSRSEVLAALKGEP